MHQPSLRACYNESGPNNLGIRVQNQNVWIQKKLRLGMKTHFLGPWAVGTGKGTGHHVLFSKYWAVPNGHQIYEVRGIGYHGTRRKRYYRVVW